MKRAVAVTVAGLLLAACGSRALGSTDAAIFNASLAQAELCAATGGCDAAAAHALQVAIDTTRKQPCATIGGKPLRQRLEDTAGALNAWRDGQQRIDRALRGMPKC